MSHGEEEEPKVHSSKVWRNLKKCGLWPRGSEQPPVLPRPATQCPPSHFRWTLIFPMMSRTNNLDITSFIIFHHIPIQRDRSSWDYKYALFRHCPPWFAHSSQSSGHCGATMKKRCAPLADQGPFMRTFPRSRPSSCPPHCQVRGADSTCTTESHLELPKCIEMHWTLSRHVLSKGRSPAPCRKSSSG